MSETYKVSGKRLKLGKPGAWKFEKRPGGWIIATSASGERRRIFVQEARGKLGASLGGTLYFGELVSNRTSGGGAAGGSDADLVAQFPGKVRKILVKEGAKVSEGEPLVLVEAMKMEFAVKAPFAGKVSRILVTEGQQLSPGMKLVDMEAGETTR